MSETKECPGCLEEVLTHNFLLHELYCTRNIVKCDLCDQRIDLSEKNIHMQTHEKVNCKYCFENFEKRLLEMHINVCPNRLEKCDYCQLQFNRLEMVSHQAKCGSRTEQCQICKKHVQKKEYEIHSNICKPPSPKRKRLQKITSLNSSDSKSDDSVQEVKMPQQQQLLQQVKPQLKQKQEQEKKKKVEQIKTKCDNNKNKKNIEEDEDEDFQKAIQLSMNYQ